jgi:hypothetical protein
MAITLQFEFLLFSNLDELYFSLPPTKFAMKQLIPLVALFFSACANPKPDFSWADAANRPRWEAAAATYSHLPGLLVRCRTASRVEVFEGLPHQKWEKDALARENKRADTLMNHDFKFYSPAMQLSSAQRAKVLSIIIRDASYQAWVGPKFCGGFHPDFLVRFHLESGVIDVHLCFGCSEAKFFDGSTLAHVDIRESGTDELKPVLQACRSKRPFPKQWPPSGVLSRDAIDSLLLRSTQPAP